MLCQLCGENEATVHLTQVVNSDVKNLHLCESCAAKKGLNTESPMALTDVLLSLESIPESAPPGADKSCPACHMRRSDFRKTSQLGCPACYETFATELGPLLAAMHKGNRHTGKVPAQARTAWEVAALRQALQDAVSKQDFEEAARLRDQIRGIEGCPKRRPARRKAAAGGPEAS